MTRKLETCHGKGRINYAYGVTNTVGDTHVRKKARLDQGWRGQPKKAREDGHQERGLGGAKESLEREDGA